MSAFLFVPNQHYAVAKELLLNYRILADCQIAIKTNFKVHVRILCRQFHAVFQ